MEKKSKFASFTKLWFLLYLVIALAFVSITIYMNVLPQKYVVAVAAVIMVISLIIMIPLCFKKYSNKIRIPAFVLSVLLIVGYGVGTYYVADTMGFMQHITNVKAIHTEEYYVVAEKTSPYEDGESIKGKEVATYQTVEQQYIEAKAKLENELGTTFITVDDMGALTESLLDKTNELILLSKASYEGICEESENVKKNTKIVYTVKIPVENKDTAKAVDITKEPFNVYITGLDVEGTIDVVSRSDVNMIVTVNPQTHKILLTSIPRDYYVQLPGKGNAYDKLTHTGIYGVSETIDTIEQLTGIEINYYVKVNYTTVTELVDAIGGITVDSDYEFTTHGMNVTYSFTEGENYLDGSQALAFARERKSFPDGDFQRNKDQQKVMKGILDKALSSKTILLNYSGILNAIDDYVEINMKPSDMQALAKMQLETMPKWNIEQQSIKGVGGSEPCYSLGGIYASVVHIDEESVAAAVEGIVKTAAGEELTQPEPDDAEE